MVESDEKELSPEEEEELEELMKHYGSPTPEEKHSVHSFLHKVAISKDTLKTGNLTAEEVGLARLPVRSIKEFELMAKELCEDDIMSKYFKQESEILTASSLSKDAKLISLAVIQEKKYSDTRSKEARKENKSWFKPKQQLSEYQE